MCIRDRYGAITSKANRIAFRDDSDYPLLCSLEEVNEDGEMCIRDSISEGQLPSSLKENGGKAR